MRVRAFAEGDAGAIGAILDETYGHDRRLRTLHGGGHGPSLEQPFRRTAVAEVDGRVVAAGTIVHGSSHPLRTWIDLVVAPGFRRQGIGTALLHELRGVAPVSLCARVRYDQAGAAPFFRRHGFGVINRSWEGRFESADVLVRLPEPRLETPSREEAAAFFERWYREVHQWDPPASRTLERALSQFCGEDMIPGSLVGIRENGELSGAANLIRPPGFDPGDEHYLVWVGAFGPDRDCPAAELLAAAVRFAFGAGKAVRFEVDESNSGVWTALHELGVLHDPALGFFAEV